MSVQGVRQSAYSVPVSNATLNEVRKLAERRTISDEALDLFVQGLQTARAQGHQLPDVFARIVPPPAMNKGQPVEDRITGVRNLLVNAGITLADLYKDRKLDIPEMGITGDATRVLSMMEAVKGIIARPVAQRLEGLLFQPIKSINDTAIGLAKQLFETSQDPALLQRLFHPPKVELKQMKIADLQGGSVRGADRYAVGDAIRVGRSAGEGQPLRFERAEVIGRDGNDLTVAVMLDGKVGRKTLSPELFETWNPLKIGDWFPDYSGSLEPGGPRGWNVGVTGVAPDGTLEVQAQHNGGQWINLRPDQVDHVASTIARQLGLAQPGSIDKLPEPTPLENGKQILARAGGVSMVAPEGFEGEKMLGAVFTDRGIGYASYNEDAASVGRYASDKDGRREVSFALACDQAGGQGKIKGPDGRNLDGEASRIANEELLAAVESIHRATVPGFRPPKAPGPEDTWPPGLLRHDTSGGTDPKAALFAAFERASDRIRQLNRDQGSSALTTASAAVVIGDTAYVASAGDSMVMHFSRDGKLKNASKPDGYEDVLIKANKGDPNAGLNYANVITRGVGQKDELGLNDGDFYSWKMAPGDYIVVATDGLLDANLQAQKKGVQVGTPWNRNHSDVTTENVGALISKSSGPMELSDRLLGYTRMQMVPDDPEGLARAKEAYRVAEEHQDGKAMEAAAHAELLAMGSGKPDNRGFSVLQYLG